MTTDDYRRLSDDYPMTIQWLFDDYPITIRWLSDEYPMTIRWLFDDCPMTIWWLSDDYPMILRWLSNDYPMTIRWLSDDYSMTLQWLSRTLDIFFLIIIDLKRSIDRRWLFKSGATFILRWSCFLYKFSFKIPFAYGIVQCIEMSTEIFTNKSLHPVKYLGYVLHKSHKFVRRAKYRRSWSGKYRRGGIGRKHCTI